MQTYLSTQFFFLCLINVTYRALNPTTPPHNSLQPRGHPSKSLKDSSHFCLYAYCWFSVDNPSTPSPPNLPRIFKTQFKQPHSRWLSLMSWSELEAPCLCSQQHFVHASSTENQSHWFTSFSYITKFFEGRDIFHIQ